MLWACRYEARIVSAHRTPERLYAFAKGAQAAGFKVIIAGAGGAAHLPGMTASLTSLPVFGVPVKSKALSGLDSLYSIVQMPPGVPVGTLAIGPAGAVNAALLAASVLGAERSDARQPPRSLAAAPDRKRRRTAEGRRVSEAAPVLQPEATIGILGGGQLGRMLALAAARLGFKCHVFAPSPDSPAFDVVHRVTTADYTDTEALDRFAGDVDVVTYEFENVPAETATFLAARVPVLPDPQVLATTQDRLVEKNFVTGLGFRTAAFADVGAPEALAAAIERIGRPAILKTRRFGYDGKGHATIKNGTDPVAAWRDVGGQPCILEAFVPFEREVSVVAARAHDGAVESFDVTENEHRDHILKTSRVPAAISEATAREARRIAETIAQKFDYVGVLAVEMFVLRDGEDPGQRDRAAGAQFRPLDDRRRFGVAVRAAHPRGGRLAARQADPPRPGRDDEPDRQRGRGLPALARGSRRGGASLRQDRGAARPQDGPCDARLCRQ